MAKRIPLTFHGDPTPNPTGQAFKFLAMTLPKQPVVPPPAAPHPLEAVLRALLHSANAKTPPAKP